MFRYLPGLSSVEPMRIRRFAPALIAIAVVFAVAGGAYGQQPATPDSGARNPPDERTRGIAQVEELPRLSNTPEFFRALRRNYPRALRAEHASGTVEVRFRVLQNGRVDPAAIHIVSSSDERFNEPTVRTVTTLRFRPARVGGRPVKVWVLMPVNWSPPE